MMDDDSEPKKFYVAFGRESDGDIKSCQISLNFPARIEEPAESAPAKEPELKDPGEEIDFQDVVDTFRSIMDGYRNFIPITLWMGSKLAHSMGFRSIHSLAEERGVLLHDRSTQDYSVFEVDIEHHAECTDLSERMDISVDAARQLPEVMLIGLVSAYDAMLGRLLGVVFRKHEEIALTSEKTLKFSDLLSYGSIEAAKAALIDKEIDTILRESHHEQFNMMERKFSMKLHEDLSIWPAFVELCERRNPITHTGGIVSAQYLASGREHKFDTSSVTAGQRLTVNAQYYSAAVNAVYEVGIKLCHTFWRKFSEDQREEADSALNWLGYCLIRDRNYELAEAVLQFGAKQKKHHSDEIRRMMIVNLANAVRLQKRPEDANAILAKEDWSAVGDKFKISVAAVRQDANEVARLLRAMGANGPVGADNYRTWPVFRGLRSNEIFAAAFEEVFGTRLLTPKKPPAQAEPPQLAEVPDAMGKAVVSTEIH